MRIEKTALDAQNRCVYSLYKEKGCIGHAVTCADCFEALEIAPEWQSRGYGSYLLREVLRQNGGFDRTAPSEFTAPLPDAGNTAAQALAAKFGFVPRGGLLVRRRVPDLTAVELTHRFLRSTLAPGGLYLDATCGNGHDTLFLCSVAGENGRVIGLDIQPQAAANTNALLAANGMAAIGRAECCDHRELLRFAPPGSADCVMFNFGWLPGAAHDVHSTADSTLPALQAGLDALKPGGVLAAVLYSGKVIGNAEKKAAAEFFRSLPLADYTVLICEFANWADTAPLPCLSLSGKNNRCRCEAPKKEVLPMLQQQTQSPGWRVLNRDVIKYIAMTAMLLNHIANIFLVPGTLWYEVLVDIGYFTAITMCYFLVEGFRYTHSRKQYALRLFGFGVVSQVPFSMAFAQNGILEFQDFNMMFTLFLCFCILLCIETIRNRFLRGVLIVLLIFGSLFCDWALLAPVFTLLFRWSGQDQKRLRFSFALSAALFGWLNYTSSVWLYPTAQCLLMACGSMAGIAASGFVILYLYNGQRAARGKNFSQWFFYLFYPVHLLVLGVIRVMG